MKNARKPVTDWETIEREYRSGALSIRELARQFNSSDGAIRNRARKAGWVREQVAAKGHVTEPPRGRPALYQPQYAKLAARLSAEGFLDREIADFLGIGHSTLNRWKADNPEFRAAMKVGRDESDDRVEAALFQRAVGYEYDAVKIFVPKGAEEPVLVPYREHVPPDPGAAIFWLKNRRARQWREKSENLSVHMTLRELIEHSQEPKQIDGAAHVVEQDAEDDAG